MNLLITYINISGHIGVVNVENKFLKAATIMKVFG